MGMPYGDTPAQHDQDPSLMPGTSKHQIFYDRDRSLLSDGRWVGHCLVGLYFPIILPSL